MNGGDGGCCLVSPGEGRQARRDVPHHWWSCGARMSGEKEGGKKATKHRTLLGYGHKNRKDQYLCHAKLASRKQQNLESSPGDQQSKNP